MLWQSYFETEPLISSHTCPLCDEFNILLFFNMRFGMKPAPALTGAKHRCAKLKVNPIPIQIVISAGALAVKTENRRHRATAI